MKPRTKFQKRVVEASKKLTPATKAQIRWAYQNCIEHIGVRTKKGIITCLECSHLWTDKREEKYIACPDCKTRLIIQDTRKRVFKDWQYFCMITACEGLQALRFFYINYYARAGKKATYFDSEVVQVWIAPDGRNEVMARKQSLFCYGEQWNFYSGLEIRPKRIYHNIRPTCIYPHQQLIPELKRNGFTGDFYKLTPTDMFYTLLTENRAETLLKAGETNLLQHFVCNGFDELDNFWSSIKICIRNGYHIKDISVWCDYIDLLRFFGKDLHNAKYVCPGNLTVEHNRYVRKKREWQKRRDNEEAKRKAKDDSIRFREMKARFFGIQFTDGLINVRVLESVDEVMWEGDAMHHCVFTNEYHLKPDSLILSACIGDRRLETIELSLSKLMVLQSRGVSNKNTEYHDRIINLVKNNMPLIQKRLAS